MKQGMTLVEMATELERQREAKKDYIADTPKLEMVPVKEGNEITVAGVGQFKITQFARRQLADKLGIPFAYFQRLQDGYPELLAENVNTFLEREPTSNMIRTLDGNIRAFLSDRYRPLDNYDLFDAIYPALKEAGAVVESSALTETKLYIKVRMPWLDRELEVPEGLKLGEGHNWFIRKIEGSGVISNSEIGAGMLSVQPGVFERMCTNLAVFKDEGFGRLHIGKKTATNDEVNLYLSDETRRLDDAAVWSRVRDTVKALMDGKIMDAMVKNLQSARSDLIKADPVKVVEVFAKREGLNDVEKGGLLRHLVGGGAEMSRYGLQYAVTRLAQDVESYDRASELERLGGRVIELPANDWKVLAEAA